MYGQKLLILPEGKIEFELDDAEDMFQIGDEAFPEGNFTQAQEGNEKNRSEPFSRNRNTFSGRETSWEEKNEKPSVRKGTRRYPQGAGRET